MRAARVNFRHSHLTASHSLTHSLGAPFYYTHGQTGDRRPLQETVLSFLPFHPLLLLIARCNGGGGGGGSGGSALSSALPSLRTVKTKFAAAAAVKWENVVCETLVEQLTPSPGFMATKLVCCCPSVCPSFRPSACQRGRFFWRPAAESESGAGEERERLQLNLDGRRVGKPLQEGPAEERMTLLCYARANIASRRSSLVQSGPTEFATFDGE